MPFDRRQHFEQVLLFQKHCRFGIGRRGKIDSVALCIEGALGLSLSVTELHSEVHHQPLLAVIDGAVEVDGALIFVVGVGDEHFVADAEFRSFALFRRFLAEFH